VLQSALVMKKRTLTLRKQTLVQLSSTRLTGVQGGYVQPTPAFPYTDPLSDACETGLTTITRNLRQ
jgi:hypothetical protein